MGKGSEKFELPLKIIGGAAGSWDPEGSKVAILANSDSDSRFYVPRAALALGKKEKRKHFISHHQCIWMVRVGFKHC